MGVGTKIDWTLSEQSAVMAAVKAAKGWQHVEATF